MICALTRTARIRLKVFALGLLALVSFPLVSAVSGSDFSRYRPRQLNDLIREYPAQGELVITRDIPIRSKVVYSGEFRDLPDDARLLIAAWAQAMNVPVAPGAFRREVKIREAGVEYWLPVQEVLWPVMNAELLPQEKIEVFVIYIGQVNGRHVFLINAFDHEGPHPAHRKR